ncbi:MAG: tyrosine-type recombinase/integrase [Oscillospiraceae bacterium]|nr:tyrosine-type recombinase/integrase [Oscillospiraceae bacterium]
MSTLAEKITEFKKYLIEQERSRYTIDKYIHDAKVFIEFVNDRTINKEIVIEFKSFLGERYAASSANSMLAAVNSFLKFIGYADLRVKPFKIQRALFVPEEKELFRNEYLSLIEAAKQQKNERLVLIVETICATGIRVSELKFITVESVGTGRAEIKCKGKLRTVFLPPKLCKLLKKYIQKQKITAGAVFITRSGKQLDRSNIWRDMKKLCGLTVVPPQKVFPHNLRHLFARTYYSLEKDLSRLADILGHSNVNTTRIYTVESGQIHARQIERLNLVITT